MPRRGASADFSVLGGSEGFWTVLRGSGGSEGPGSIRVCTGNACWCGAPPVGSPDLSSKKLPN